MTSISSDRRKAVLIFCLIYVVGHIAVALLSIRIWPFTDYPMFADVSYKDDEISVYRYAALMSDGSARRLERSFANGYGIGELNLSKLLRTGDKELVKIILAKWLARQSNRSEIVAIQVLLVKAHRPRSPADELVVSEEPLLTISSQELQ